MVKKIISISVSVFILIVLIAFGFSFIDLKNKKEKVLIDHYKTIKADYEKNINLLLKENKNLTDNYNKVVSNYNLLIKKTILTEIIVKEQNIKVIVKNANRVVKTINCNFNINSLIYIDFMIHENKVLIYRIYDEKTPPSLGINIFDEFERKNIGIDVSEIIYGKSIFKKFKEDGIYQITITGNGALDVQKKTNDKFLFLPLFQLKNFEFEDLLEESKFNFKPVEIKNEDIKFFDVIVNIF